MLYLMCACADAVCPNGISIPVASRVQDSFHHVREWLTEVDKYAQTDPCKLLIGNKCDRTDRVVTEQEGSTLSRELNMPFLETSARTAENVEAAFVRMAEQLIKNKCVHYMERPSRAQRVACRVTASAPRHKAPADRQRSLDRLLFCRSVAGSSSLQVGQE